MARDASQTPAFPRGAFLAVTGREVALLRLEPGGVKNGRPAWSGRRQGRSCSGGAGRVRSGAAGTSPPAISLAEHRVEFGVGPDRPDLLRAAAGDGDLGRPPQRLLA
jgi:hypothetical protein